MKTLIKILLVGALFLALASCTTVDSGSVGIRFKKWAANETEQGGVMGTCQGFVWFNPFTQSIYEYPKFVQRKAYDNISVNAKDASIFQMSPVIAYRLDPEKVTDIFVKYRKSLREIEDGYIRTCIYEAYRTCGNQFSSDSLMSNRETFEAEVRRRLEISLGQEGFIVEEFTAQIDPPSSLKMAIDEKNKAIQSALKAENQVKEAEAQAKIKIAVAEGEANALKIKGDGEAYYNKVVSSSLTTLLVRQYELEKWKGEYPKVMGGNTSSIVDLR